MLLRRLHTCVAGLVITLFLIIAHLQVQADLSQQTATGDWTVVASPTDSRLGGVDVISNQDVYAVGGAYLLDQDPIVLHYDGANWEVDSTFSSTNQHLSAVSFSDAANGWSVGYQTRSRYVNGVWEHQAFNGTFFYGVDMVDASFGVVVGFYYDFFGGFDQYGSIQTYTNGSWQEIGARLDETYLDVVMLDANEGWIVGDSSGSVYLSYPASAAAVNGIVLHRATALEDWVPVHETDGVLFGVDAVSTDKVWAVGENGTIIHYDGSIWQSVDSPVDADLRAIAMTSADSGWIVGEGGTILHFTDGSWQSVTSPAMVNLYDVEISSSGTAWAVGEGGTILYYEPSAVLAAYHDAGAPGSYFTFTGEFFPIDDIATVTLNGRLLGTVSTDNEGRLTFQLDSSTAEDGVYMVTVSSNPNASYWFTVETGLPIRPQAGDSETFLIPANIAFDNALHLPVVLR